MRCRRFGHHVAVGAVLMLCAASAAAAAPKQGICAMQQAVACGAVEMCERALPAGVNLPALMRFDVEAGVIESRNEKGDFRKSKISSSSEQGKALVLEGVDGGHPWAMRINIDNGEFTLSVLREDEGFLGFGVCSAKILD